MGALPLALRSHPRVMSAGSADEDGEERGFKARDALTGRGKSTDIELDREALFTLASDTRLDILRSLRSHRRTVSQLAELLDIDKAAVHRHLKKLEEGGFVQRDRDHGFVYYGLTWKSRGILSPTDNTRIVILLSAAALCIVTIIALAVTASAPPEAPMQAEFQPMSDSPAPAAPSLASDLYPWIPVAVLGLAAFALLYSAFLYWRRPRQKGKEGVDLPEEFGAPEGRSLPAVARPPERR